MTYLDSERRSSCCSPLVTSLTTKTPFANAFLCDLAPVIAAPYKLTRTGAMRERTGRTTGPEEKSKVKASDPVGREESGWELMASGRRRRTGCILPVSCWHHH